jgi:anhydro-N-acetylmuramic acid kinase
MTSHSSLYIGIMSGTSLDGIDVALVNIDQSVQMVASHFLPYPALLKAKLLALQTPYPNELEDSQLISVELAHLYAEAVLALLAKNQHQPNDIAAIGCHGQTIRHQPALGFTLQIGNHALLTELTNITVIGDFRSRDIAAGGQGAPLVPAFHQAVFSSNEKNRAIINIGGIANITYLSKHGTVLGFDSGPGNMLLDHWVQLKLGQHFDADGAWSATGVVHQSFLTQMLTEPYFALPPPKSTGRDLFNQTWLQQHILYPHCHPQDIARTLVELSAQTIAQAIITHCSEVDEIFLCGGGARNTLLVSLLKQMLNPIPIANTDVLGVNVDWVEATAFAWLAHQTLNRTPSNIPSVTGAKGLRILGAIYPS